MKVPGNTTDFIDCSTNMYGWYCQAMNEMLKNTPPPPPPPPPHKSSTVCFATEDCKLVVACKIEMQLNQ